MTDHEIAFLKASVDKPVKIKTKDGENLIAEFLLVTHSPEYDEHDFFCKLLDSDRLPPHGHREAARDGGMEIEDVASLQPHHPPLAMNDSATEQEPLP